jgi:hypothetical protein
VYDGAGRVFDPALGLYLQPDPFGGAPEAPESLNRYAAPGVSTFPTVGSVPGDGHNYANLVVQLAELHHSLEVNSGKAGLVLIIASKLAPRLRQASLVERLVKETYLRRVAKHALLEKGTDAALGTIESLWRGRGVRPIVGGLLSPLYGPLKALKVLNTTYVKETRLVSRLVPNEAPLGRLAGWLAKDRWGLEAPGLDLGVGLVVDVGFQAISDLGMLRRGELTRGQYAGRLGVEFGGSVASWWVAGQVGGAFGGPAGFVAGIAVAVTYDFLFKPFLYEWLDLNPGR